jgi:hypothetical protein
MANESVHVPNSPKGIRYEITNAEWFRDTQRDKFVQPPMFEQLYLHALQKLWNNSGKIHLIIKRSTQYSRNQKLNKYVRYTYNNRKVKKITHTPLYTHFFVVRISTKGQAIVDSVVNYYIISTGHHNTQYITQGEHEFIIQINQEIKNEKVAYNHISPHPNGIYLKSNSTRNLPLLVRQAITDALKKI